MMSELHPASLMVLARQMHREADNWLPLLERTGQLDRESFARMEDLRHELLAATPHSALDRLMQLGAMKTLLAFALGLFTLEDEHLAEVLPILHACLSEMALGFIALQPQLEADADQTLEGLGLFTDKTTLN